MQDIALDHDLALEFFKFYSHGAYDQKTLQALFSKLRPFYCSAAAVHALDIPATARQAIISSKGIWQVWPSTGLSEEETLKEMVKASKFKVVLSNRDIQTDLLGICFNYRRNSAMQLLYAGKYTENESRSEALRHIKSFLSEAKISIMLSDRYLYNCLTEALDLVEPYTQPSISLHVHAEDKEAIKNECTRRKLNVKVKDIKRTQHDRYINIDGKIEILLSSGLDNLFKKGKDFTYIIREL